MKRVEVASDVFPTPSWSVEPRFYVLILDKLVLDQIIQDYGMYLHT